jgi:hypothetical protein
MFESLQLIDFVPPLQMAASTQMSGYGVNQDLGWLVPRTRWHALSSGSGGSEGRWAARGQIGASATGKGGWALYRAILGIVAWFGY